MIASPVRVLSVLALFLSLALVLLRTPAEAAEEAGLNEPLDRLDLPVPAHPPLTLEETLASAELVTLRQRLGTARVQMSAGPIPSGVADVAAFEAEYPLVDFSVLDVLVNHPHMVRVVDLVRSVELNPMGVFIPQAEIRRLEELVTCYRVLVGAVVNARERESHFLSLSFARENGVIPVSRHRQRIPAARVEQYHELALLEDPSGADSYERIRRAFEARYVQEIIAGDVVLFHGASAYVLPKGSVLPRLRHYDGFIDDHALAMIYDVADFFSRQGALDGDRVDQILSGAGRALNSSGQ